MHWNKFIPGDVSRLLSISIAAFLSLPIAAAEPILEQPPVKRQPNVIIVLADDLGWSELNCYGNDFNETPAIDRLAQTGVRFTQAYAAAPVCSPYRAALLTGQYPARIGITDYLRPNSANGLSSQNLTLAEMFRRNGYATGIIGKWHLTGYRHHGAEYETRPEDHGFDWSTACEVKGVGNGANFWPYVFRTQPIRWLDIPQKRFDGEFLVDRMNIEAVDFIHRHHDRPFLLMLSHYAVHSILNGKPDLVNHYRQKHPPGESSRTRCYLCEDSGHKGDVLNHWASDHNPHLAAMLQSIDEGVGRIQTALMQHNISDQTIFIFTSDNGGETNVTSNKPLRGGKSELYEGGIRIPLIVSWPDRIEGAGVSDQVTTNVDLYPTLLEAANIEPDRAQELDGESILSNWTDTSTRIQRESIYWHYPLDRPHFLGGRSAGAIRSGDWKLIEFFDTGEKELYSLTDDPGEHQNLATTEPNRVTELSHRLAKWQTQVSARTPSPPLLTEPRSLTFGDHFSPRQTNNRWFFSKDWSVEGGVLQRSPNGAGTTRIFLKDTQFRNALIRFDFQFQQASDIRFITGANGHYNTVIHLRPDHFYIQTAKDPDVPCFSFRHGECAFKFETDRWYSMTVEFIGDQVVAHLDHQHIAYAKHPIIDQERTYFAFQVDEKPAAIDNVQILTVSPHKQQAANLELIRNAQNLHPVHHELQEAYNIQKTNAHEWFYQRDEKYRSLVLRVAALDEENRKRYPEALATHKEIRKKIANIRRTLLEEDAKFKEKLFATYRANRAIDKHLVSMQPDAAALPDSQRKREMERIRRRIADTPEYLKLLADRDRAQTELEKAYPELFVTDTELTERRNEKREQLEQQDGFRKHMKERAEAWRRKQDYLLEHDRRLNELHERLQNN